MTQSKKTAAVKPAQKTPLKPAALQKVAGGVSQKQCEAAGGTWDKSTKVCSL